MLNKLALLLLSFFLLFSAHADNNVAAGYYGIQHRLWPCEKSLAVFRDVPIKRMSILWNTFGTERGCIKKFLTLPGEKELEIHLINEVCMKWGRCGSYEFNGGMRASEFNKALKDRKPKFMATLDRYMLEVRRFLDNNMDGSTRCYISPGLESNLDRQAATILTTRANTIYPRCSIVWNPTGSSPITNLPAQDVFEKHGAKVRLTPPCISNLDGEDMYEVDVPAYLVKQRNCLQAHLWTGRFNLISHGPFVDPRRRTNFPTLEDFNFVSKYLHSGELSPPVSEGVGPESLVGCDKVVRTSDGAGGFLWKPKSDTQPGAVVLFPGQEKNQFSFVKIVHKGQVIKDLSFSGWGNPDQDGKRQHWRVDVPGYRLPKPIVIRTSTKKCWVIENCHERFD